MKIHQLSVDEAFASIQSGNDGLTATEAGRRLAEFGPNMANSFQLARKPSLSLAHQELPEEIEMS